MCGHFLGFWSFFFALTMPCFFALTIFVWGFLSRGRTPRDLFSACVDNHGDGPTPPPAPTCRTPEDLLASNYAENHELLRNAVRGNLVVTGNIVPHAQQTGALIIARAIRILV
jgi:hypothetical protein